MKQSSLKDILLIQTGGTIACKPNPYGLLAPDTQTLSTERISACFPDGVNVEINILFNLDSTDIEPMHWKTIAETLYALQDKYDGFVITHGTDTLQYTAAALDVMLPHFPKPVMLTGAQKAFDAPNSDAPFNLTTALVAARDIAYGVFVVFCGRIIHGRSAVKLYSMSDDGFVDAFGEAGSVTPEAAMLQQPLPPITASPALCMLDERVFYLKITPNSNTDVLDFIEQAGYRGIVCEAYGMGGIPSVRQQFVSRLGELRQSGILVALVSQCVYEGTKLGVYHVGEEARKYGFLALEHATGSYALVWLMRHLAEKSNT